MPTLAQLAGMLVLVAEAGGPWAPEPSPQDRELFGPRLAFQGAASPSGPRVTFQGAASPSASGPGAASPSEHAFTPGAEPASPPNRPGATGTVQARAEGSHPLAGAPGTEIRARSPTPLAPPGADKGNNRAEGSRSLAGPASLFKVGGGLALVLGLFLIVAWAMRRVGPASSPLLPREVVEVLGRAPLAGRQQVHLIRLGRKLVLVSVTATGIETLSEVTEPEEVDRLTGLCRQTMPGSATAAFREVLHQVVGTAAGRAA